MGSDSFPSTIGRYVVLEQLGQGGMGTVYRALDPRIGRTVAVKLLRMTDSALNDRFLQEARSAGRLSHRNIVTVHDFGDDDGRPYIVMELIEGETLASLIHVGSRLTLTQRLLIIADLGRGLAYAHSRGVIHRDVKPANVMVTPDGVLKILDFGIARMSESGLTKTGSLIGTLNYMSPEHIQGKPVDERSDLFALGAVGYEVLSGHQAFPGATLLNVMNAIVNDDPPALSDVCAGYNPLVYRIINRALSKDPLERQQSVALFVEEIERCLDGSEAETLVGLVVGLDARPVRTPVPRPRTDRSLGTQDKAAAVLAEIEKAQALLAAREYTLAVEAAARAVFQDPTHDGAAQVLRAARAAHAEQRSTGSESADPNRTVILPPSRPVPHPLQTEKLPEPPSRSQVAPPLMEVQLPTPVARRDPAPAPGRSPRVTPWYAWAAALGVPVVALGGWLAFRQTEEPPPAPVPATTTTVAPLPSAAVVPALPPPGAPALPAAEVRADAQLLEETRAAIRTGNLTAAATNISASLPQSPRRGEWLRLQSDLLRQAETLVTTAAAEAAGATARHEQRVREAEAERAGAVQAAQSGRLATAIAAYQNVAALYRRAIDEAPVATTSTVPVAQIAAATTTVPATTTRPTTAPPTTSTIPTIGIDDVNRLLASFGLAYGRFDRGGVERLYPNLPPQERERLDAFRRSYRRCTFSYTNVRIDGQGADQARVVVDVARGCEASTGQRDRDTAENLVQQFELARAANGQWQIRRILESGR